MPNYKIYRKNNYLFVQDTVTDEIISGLAKDVRVYRLEKTDGNAYKFVNTSNDTKLASVPYTSIKEEDGTDFADEDAFVTFYTTFTGTTSTGGGGGSQTLPDTLLLGDREVKTVLVSTILADTGDYTFEDGDETKLVVLNADNANNDTFTVTIPFTAPEFAEYKVLFTTGENGFANNVVTYTPTAGNQIFGRAIQNSDENSIACIKVLQGGGNSSITYQSSNGDSAYLILDGTLTSQNDTDPPSVDWITQIDGVTTGAGAITMGYLNVGEYTFGKVGYFEAAKVFFDASLFVGSDSGAITSLIPLYEFSAPDALFIRCAKVSDGSANNNEITNVRFRITIKQ